MPERSSPHHYRKSWGCWWGQWLVSASSGSTVSTGPVIPEVFLFQLRSCEICTPRISMFSTQQILSTRPGMLSGPPAFCRLTLVRVLHLSAALMVRAGPINVGEGPDLPLVVRFRPCPHGRKQSFFSSVFLVIVLRIFASTRIHWKWPKML